MEMAIPVYIMEEHKEAYYYWYLMLANKEIDNANNYLLHVDHHADNQGGVYSFTVAEAPVSLEEAKRLSYEELGIADFILPAIYQRLFDQMYYLLQFGNKSKSYDCILLCQNQNTLGIRLNNPLIRKAMTMGMPQVANIHSFEYLYGGLGELNKPADKKLVLDVDLDYFVWDNSLSTAEPRRIEITKEQYELIQKDSFHYLRIEPKLSYRTVEENGRYYLESAACIPADPMPDKETILERMDNFFAWLKDKNIQPAAIDICRSRISGYLPRTVFPWIEEEFLERLGRLYAIEIKARPQ